MKTAVPNPDRSLSVWVFGLLASLAIGCSGKSEVLAPVSGKVIVEGKPITTGSVSFRPDAEKGNKSLHHPTGTIDAEGTYKLYTVGREGAPPGWYKVLVFANSDPNPAPGKPSLWLHHERYTAESTTDYHVEVVKQPTPNRYDLMLSR